MIVSFSFFPKKFWILPIAFNWLFAFRQIFATCFSKFNLLSISIPKSVTDFSDEIIESFIFKSYLFSFLSELKIIAWNLSVFTIKTVSKQNRKNSI